MEGFDLIGKDGDDGAGWCGVGVFNSSGIFFSLFFFRFYLTLRSTLLGVLSFGFRFCCEVV